MERPPEAHVLHKGTHQVVLVLTALSDDRVWLDLGNLVEATGLHRDTLRAILGQLAEAGWVHHRLYRGEIDLWALGAELPRLALAFHARLAQRATALRQELDQLQAPTPLTRAIPPRSPHG